MFSSGEEQIGVVQNKFSYMKIIKILFFSLTTLGQTLYASTYYVASNGNDTNPGTLDLPWRAVSYASSNTSPGDTVYIKAGLYNETIVISKSGTSANPIVFIGYKSTPGDAPPLLVNNANPYSGFLSTDMPTFDGGNRAFGIGFNCRNQKYLVIKNFQIQNYAYGLIAGGAGQDAGNLTLYNVNTRFTGNVSSSYAGYGILFGSMGTLFSSNDTIINCQVVNSAAEGISLNGNNSFVKGCKVYCNETSSNAATDYYMMVTGSYNLLDSCYIERAPGLSHSGHGYSAKTNAEQVIDQGLNLPAIASEHNTFRFCVARNMGESFCVRHRTARYNLFYHCKAIGTHTGIANSSSGEGNGVVIRDGASDNIFDGCIAENCASAIRFNDTVEDGDTGSNPSGHPGNNNLIINGIEINCYAGINFNDYSIPSDAGNNIIANCTFYKTRYFFIASRHCQNMKYINDIFYGTLPYEPGGDFKIGNYANDIIPNGANTYFSHCDFMNIEDGLPANFLSSAINCIAADPLFKDNINADLHLQSGSPCISAGLTLDFAKYDFDSIQRPQGANFDMGAFEFQVVTAVTDITSADHFVRIFPNPVLSRINILSSKKMNRVIIYNMEGKVVQMINTQADKLEISCSEFASGIYLFKIQHGKGEETVKVEVIR